MNVRDLGKGQQSQHDKTQGRDGNLKVASRHAAFSAMEADDHA
jgi:hypothetical protein